jgi:hypothetical protein
MKEIKILEKGNISFFYRPKLYMILSAQDSKSRLIIIGEEKIPDTRENKNWAFVDKVGNTEQIKKELLKADPMGEGIYKIVRHEDHTHLAYAIEFPEEPKKMQKKFNISKEGNFIITVKNPKKQSNKPPNGTGLAEEQRAEYPKELEEKFGNKKFIILDPVDFLDYEGAEIILIDTQKSVSENLGIRLTS